MIKRLLLIAALALASLNTISAQDAPKVDENTVIVRMTPEQAQVTINLIDVAVRAKGLEAALSGAVISAMLRQAIDQASKKKD